MPFLKRCKHRVEGVYAIRTAKDTPEMREFWFGWVLGRHVCEDCGERFLDLRVGGRPL